MALGEFGDPTREAFPEIMLVRALPHETLVRCPHPTRGEVPGFGVVTMSSPAPVSNSVGPPEQHVERLDVLDQFAGHDHIKRAVLTERPEPLTKIVEHNLEAACLHLTDADRQHVDADAAHPRGRAASASTCCRSASVRCKHAASRLCSTIFVRGSGRSVSTARLM